MPSPILLAVSHQKSSSDFSVLVLFLLLVFFHLIELVQCKTFTNTKYLLLTVINIIPELSHPYSHSYQWHLVLDFFFSLSFITWYLIGAMIIGMLSFVDYLCIWNTHFQTLQASKEMSGRICSQVWYYNYYYFFTFHKDNTCLILEWNTFSWIQLWCYSGKLYVPHGKMLSVIPFECQKSSLAATMGKLKQSRSGKDFCWNMKRLPYSYLE